MGYLGGEQACNGSVLKHYKCDRFCCKISSRRFCQELYVCQEFGNLKFVENHPCALELQPFFGFLKPQWGFIEVNFKYHEEISFFRKRAPLGLEPAMSRVTVERLYQSGYHNWVPNCPKFTLFIDKVEHFKIC